MKHAEIARLKARKSASKPRCPFPLTRSGAIFGKALDIPRTAGRAAKAQ